MVAKTTPCGCKQAHHVHGDYRMYVTHGCRCSTCKEANNTRARRRRRQTAYGRSPYTSADRSREHVISLTSNGLGIKQIHKISGVPASSISRLLYGRTERGEGLAKRILKTNEAKILAVQPSLDNMADAQPTDGTGTIRRLQALMAVGWSAPILAERMGLNDAAFRKLLASNRKVFVSTYRNARRIYDELWNQEPPQTNRFERSTATRARNLAARKGWPPPMAWDDDHIDNPKAKPSGTRKH